MPYTWLSGALTPLAAVGHEGVHALTSVSSNEVLKRVVFYWYVNIQTQDSAVLATWTQYGVLSLLQWTEGEIPPTPAEMDAGAFDERDILDSQYFVPRWGGVFNNQYQVPGEGQMGHMDTPVQRKGDGVPGIVWWVWGLPNFAGAGVEVGYPKCWYRVLIETPA